MRSFLVACLLLVSAPAVAQDYRLPHDGSVPNPFPDGYPFCIQIFAPPKMIDGKLKYFIPRQIMPPFDEEKAAVIQEARRRGLIVIIRCTNKET